MPQLVQKWISHNNNKCKQQHTHTDANECMRILARNLRTYDDGFINDNNKDDDNDDRC